MNDMNIFELECVSFSYKNGRKALDGVSFQVSEGESVSILGANGCGKSTLLYLLQGLLRPGSGRLRVFSTDDDFSDASRARISLLFQNSQAQLFSLSVLDELMFGPLHLRGMGPGEALRRAEDVMEMLGIGRLRDRSPWQLSEGEMKKVALGACLSTNPDVFLLDEPTSGLDPRSQVGLMELIAALKRAGKTIITATHDLHAVSEISERTIVIGEDHSVLAYGAAQEILKNHGLLLKANLVHEHVHAHQGYEHEHTHCGPHDHEHHEDEHSSGHGETAHAREGAAAAEKGAHGHKGSEEAIQKLKILLPHWAEHNIEHARTYGEWALKAETAGAGELASLLKEIKAESEKLNALFEKAEKTLET